MADRSKQLADRDPRPGRFIRKGFPEPERKLDAEEAARLKVKQDAILAGKFDPDPGDNDLPGRMARAMPKVPAGKFTERAREEYKVNPRLEGADDARQEGKLPPDFKLDDPLDWPLEPDRLSGTEKAIQEGKLPVDFEHEGAELMEESTVAPKKPTKAETKEMQEAAPAPVPSFEPVLKPARKKSGTKRSARPKASTSGSKNPSKGAKPSEAAVEAAKDEQANRPPDDDKSLYEKSETMRQKADQANRPTEEK